MRPVAQADRHDGPRLVDEVVPGVAAVVEDIVVRPEDAVGDPVVAHELPDVFDRVEIPWGVDSGPLPGSVRLLPPSLRRRSCKTSCLDLTSRPLSAPILAQSLCTWN